ncbi:MAG: DUF6516 family protein [Methanosarcinales archaeon]|nr:DUF6516 family protein [Methanosarcinales archaeon]
MVIADYFRSVEQILNNSRLIIDKSIEFTEFSSDEGMIRGRLLFMGGYLLDFMEYISIGKERLKYRFNLSDNDSNLIFRYDNAPHHKDILSFPHHKHTGTKVEPSTEIGIAQVISEIEIIVFNESKS